ncbi:D-alanyl-D-alanine carboxypeptidase family protein [Streptomyces sp. NPDC058052]|uniref:D-alanyl-D-alanine carboxypeptidase family protein n=1 Tax=Streptomyces sp. NPDC058052 TaxID=3346316 RepID=UPI0036E60260
MSLSPAHRVRVAGGALALLLVTVLGFSVSGPGPGTDGSSAPSSPSGTWSFDDGAVPWPEEGQTAVALEGSGPVGTRGDRSPVPIASLAKVMTAHVILQEHPLRPGEEGPLIEVDRQAAHEAGVGGESKVPLRAGSRHSQRRLLQMLLIPSGNNVARLLARWDAGSQEAFAAKMRRAADRLGMDRSTYTGASGIEPTTTSTAADQLVLARTVMKHPVFREIVATRTVTVPGVGPLTNTNPLLDVPGVVGIKTGSSTPAGGNLLWACEVRLGGEPRLLVGAVLHQRADTTPGEGLRAAVDSSRRLIAGLRDQLPRAGTEG